MCTIEIEKMENGNIKVIADKETREYIIEKQTEGLSHSEIWNELFHNDQCSIGNNSEWRYLEEQIACFSEPVICKDYDQNDEGEYTRVGDVFLFNCYSTIDELKTLVEKGEIELSLYKD